jgi:hypothetical protein
MTNANKILSLVRQNNGYIASKQVKAIGISIKYLTDLVKNRKS